MSVLAQQADCAHRKHLTRGRRDYEVAVSSDWETVAGQWIGAATPFQEVAWLGAWYRALGTRSNLVPLFITARNRATGEVAVRLPLIRHRRRGLEVIEFADLHLTDYNAPAFGPAAPVDQEGAKALWRAIRRALPPADLLRLTKMPLTLGERRNPLALLPGTSTCSLNGNLIRIGDDWAAWRRGLEKPVRKELERSWRVFSRQPGTAFEVVTDPGRLQIVVDAMESQQQRQMRSKGMSYILSEPDIAHFYHEVIERGVPTEYAVVSALTSGENVIASLLGICAADRYVMIRISNAGGRWSNCSPGRLIIERTMAALHARGYRVFDLSVGNYDYKRRLGVQPVPLVDLTEALSLAGHAARLYVYIRKKMASK